MRSIFVMQKLSPLNANNCLNKKQYTTTFTRICCTIGSITIIPNTTKGEIGVQCPCLHLRCLESSRRVCKRVRSKVRFRAHNETTCTRAHTPKPYKATGDYEAHAHAYAQLLRHTHTHTLHASTSALLRRTELLWHSNNEKKPLLPQLRDIIPIN